MYDLTQSSGINERCFLNLLILIYSLETDVILVTTLYDKLNVTNPGTSSKVMYNCKKKHFQEVPVEVFPRIAID